LSNITIGENHPRLRYVVFPCISAYREVPMDKDTDKDRIIFPFLGPHLRETML
jgi:hypothetical protein